MAVRTLFFFGIVGGPWYVSGLTTTTTTTPRQFHSTSTSTYPSSTQLWGVQRPSENVRIENNLLTQIEEDLQVGERIGSGSYGTVHFLSPPTTTNHQKASYIGKRPWTFEDLKRRAATEQEKETTSSLSSLEKPRKTLTDRELRERADRCLYYWQVEDHCFSKLPPHPQLPPYLGTRQISKENNAEWMAFELVGDDETGTPAPTLADLMKLDRQHSEDIEEDDFEDSMSHSLFRIGQGLGCDTYSETLDTTLTELLTVLDHVHSHQIVHRDIKPSNVLVWNGRLLLMDFGSAADLEPATKTSGGFFGGSETHRWGLEDPDRVAVSPMYCAPEVYIDLKEAPCAFDMFSAALLVLQLLFGYLEERVDAGFHQQLKEADWELNAWLSNELASKLRPQGLEQALEYLAERPGWWSLLQGMLSKDPTRRPTAKEALSRLSSILPPAYSVESTATSATLEEADGPFLAMVVESMELCELPAVSRPLHFVTTFVRKKPLGLVFSEAVNLEGGDDIDTDSLWLEATKEAEPGEVFVKELVPGGQADALGIIHVGDRLQGIGELTFTAGGFEKAVEMLQDQPRGAKNVKVHFDRIRVRKNEAIPIQNVNDLEISIVDQGVWSTKGRRQTQEDAFVLHEIHDTKDHSVLVLGVMDGHGGTAASTLISSELPTVLSNEMIIRRRSLAEALEDSWDTICKSYHQQCTNEDQCVAQYDAAEGKLNANTGSENLIAGSTASIMALDEASGELVVLNCGDSRSMVVTAQGKVQFVTQDHTPQTEEERLLVGISTGLDYSPPKCRISKWTISAGRYEYSVGRSLEGPFVTSKGIVSQPDISRTAIVAGQVLVSASDGLWEVMDSEEVAFDLFKMRKQGLNARDAARSLCSMAFEKGTSDNVSAVVVYV